MLLYYFGLKTAFLFGLVKTFAKFEPLQKHWLFVAFVYTLGVAALSWVFLMAPQQVPTWTRSLEVTLGLNVGLISPKMTQGQAAWRAWEIWLVETLALSSLYFGLMAKFSEGLMFWVLLLSGLLLVIF
jgi:hypothetical protein